MGVGVCVKIKGGWKLQGNEWVGKIKLSGDTVIAISSSVMFCSVFCYTNKYLILSTQGWEKHTSSQEQVQSWQKMLIPFHLADMFLQ